MWLGASSTEQEERLAAAESPASLIDNVVPYSPTMSAEACDPSLSRKKDRMSRSKKKKTCREEKKKKKERS